MSADSTPIESYLDELMLAARVLPVRDARHLLAEVEAHLRDSAEAAERAGVAEYDAALAAIADFGPVANLVERERARVRVPLKTLAAQVVRTGYLLGAIGAIAVGVSGAVAAIIYWIGGASAIAPVPQASDLTPSNCARWTALSPGLNCRQAAVSDWASETMFYRIALGLLGVGALFALKHVSRRRNAGSGLAPIVTESIATTLFVVAALVTLALGVDAFVTTSGRGAGQWLSATPIAMAATWIFGSRLSRRLREPATG